MPATLSFIWPDIAFVAIFLLAVTPFVWRFPFGFVDAAPEEALAYLSRRLRATGRVVRAAPLELGVDLGHGATVKLYAVAEHAGTRILYRADPTALGWISVVRLPWIYRRVRAWAREAASTLVPSDGKLPGPPALDDVRALLLDALSETYRLAAEAYAAERETYLNSQALIVLAGIMMWFLLFLGLSLTSSDPDFNWRMVSSASAALAFTVAVGLPGSWLIRRFRRDRMAGLRSWVDRLQAALQRESARPGKEDRGESSLELLMKSHGEVSRWQEAARRAGMSVDPTSWWFVFVLVYFGVDLLLWEAPSFAVFSLPLGFVLGVAGIAIIAGAILYYRRWKRRRNEMLTRMRAEWDRGYERLRDEMDLYLGRL